MADKALEEVKAVEAKVVAVPAEVKAEVKEVENVHPGRIWSNFEEFFVSYAKEHNINKNWLKVIKSHLKDNGWLKNQKDWIKGITHFGC